MNAVWLRVRTGLRRDWRSPVVFTLVTALMGAIVLVSLAGARRTDTAVARFLQYAGPTEAQVTASPAAMTKIAALPGVGYAARGALMFALPVTGGHAETQVATWALVDHPPQQHAIVVAGRWAVAGRPGEVMINEAAARVLRLHVGSALQLRGYRPDQLQRALNGSVQPTVPLPAVHVVGIIRRPSDLAQNLGLPRDVIYAGNGSVYVGSAFYRAFSPVVAHDTGLNVHLTRGRAGLPAFEAAVRRVAGPQAKVQTGSDDAAAAATAQRGTSLLAYALLLFGLIVALAMLVVLGQGTGRLAYAASADFPALRALGFCPGQLFAVALAPAVLIGTAGMGLAIPAAYGLSVLTPIGQARQADITPGLSFNAAILLGGAAALAALLACGAAITARRVLAFRTGQAAVGRPGGTGSRAGRLLAGWGFPPPAVAGVRLAFAPGRGAAAVPVRSAVTGIAVSLAAVMAALIFGSSLAHLIGDPAVTGWDWTVAVGNPHAGDARTTIEPRLRSSPDVAGYTVTTLGAGRLAGHEVTVVGMQLARGNVSPPVLAGRLPQAPGEIALSGGELRALHTRPGGTVMAQRAGSRIALRVTGQVVLSPEITNEQAQLGDGGVMTLAGADTVSGSRLPRNVFLVQLRHPADPRGTAALKREFPGVVLPAVPPPEVRNLQVVSSLPLVLALLLALLAAGVVAHTLVTSVRRRRRDLAILKAIGFVRGQVRAAVAWQATAIAAAGLAVGLPLGAIIGRWAWAVFAGLFAIRPVPVISPLVLLAVPAILLVANATAAIPGRTAARTQAAAALRAE